MKKGPLAVIAALAALVALLAAARRIDLGAALRHLHGG
jgi:hypothetical protein